MFLEQIQIMEVIRHVFYPIVLRWGGISDISETTVDHKM